MAALALRVTGPYAHVLRLIVSVSAATMTLPNAKAAGELSLFTIAADDGRDTAFRRRAIFLQLVLNFTHTYTQNIRSSAGRATLRG